MSKDNENKNVEASSQKAEMAYFSEQGTKKNDDSK